MNGIDRHWYKRGPVSYLLLPVSWLFCSVVAIRRSCYRLALLKSYRLSAPVIVVGNISVGGTGKTPLVACIVKHLRSAGYRPGIISRGYGGRAHSWPQPVTAKSDPVQVGDEPVLLASHCDCPISVGPDRIRDATNLIEEHDCNVIVSDDGLQHYRLRRDIEIVVMDGERGAGNGHCLPAGPLREPQSRLKSADYIVTTGAAAIVTTGAAAIVTTGAAAAETTGATVNVYRSELEIVGVENLQTGEQRALDSFTGAPVHAVAGIGNPQRFFSRLRAARLSVIEHPFADHSAFEAADIQFDDDLPVLMTEKDGVKCRSFAGSRHWQVVVEARVPEELLQHITEKLRRING
jgi:tetraacyldisaccharide 4'-kinase